MRIGCRKLKIKINEIGRELPWHLVGHLQTNKARRAVQLFDVIHSVDSVALGRKDSTILRGDRAEKNFLC